MPYRLLEQMIAKDRCKDVLDFLVEDALPHRNSNRSQALNLSSQYYQWARSKRLRTEVEENLKTDYNQIVMGLTSLLSELENGNFQISLEKVQALSKGIRPWEPAHNVHNTAELNAAAQFLNKSKAALSDKIIQHLKQTHAFSAKDLKELKFQLMDGLILLSGALSEGNMELLDDPRLPFNMDKFEAGMFRAALDRLVNILPAPPRLSEVSVKNAISYIEYFKSQI